MKKIKFLMLLLCLFSVFVIQAQMHQNNFKIKITQPYLKIPIKKGIGMKSISIEYEPNFFYSFDAEIDLANPDWYAYLDVAKWKGKELGITINPGLTNTSALIFEQVGKKETTDYNESFRGQLHYTPQKGWVNDPNGMVYYNGEYHIFYQHNPYSTKWGNMHWGHAVSKDLIHWKEQEVALYPDRFGTIYSGSAVVDHKNTSGLAKNGKVPMLLFYTAAGKPRTQNMAISYDGRNFEKYPKPLVGEIVPWNRDPKVFWHEPTKKWIMLIYGTLQNEQHVMYFLISSNLIDWERTSEVYGDFTKSARYLYECPDFFELSVQGNEKIKKWVLLGANSQYAIGVFDGYKFTPEIERLNNMIGRGYYATQVFSNEPKGRTIQIGWWQTDTDSKGMRFNQSMSLPTELRLIETSDGLRLARKPIQELQLLRKKEFIAKNVEIFQSTKTIFDDLKADVFEFITSFKVQGTALLKINAKEVTIHYDMKTQELIIDGIKKKIPPINGTISLHVFVDRTGIDILVNDGLYYIPYAKNLEPQDKSIISSEGGNVMLDKLEVYELNGIWK